MKKQSVFSYFQDLVIAVSRLEDYGLAKAITSNSESRPSGELSKTRDFSARVAGGKIILVFSLFMPSYLISK